MFLSQLYNEFFRKKVTLNTILYNIYDYLLKVIPFFNGQKNGQLGGISMPRRGENIHKRKDGRWEGRYIKGYDMTGKAKYGSVYAKTYLEAKHKLICINEKMINKSFPAQKTKLIFSEVLYLWLENNHLKLKPQTYIKYLFLIESHIIPCVGKYAVEKINSTMVNKFLAEKSYQGRLDGNGGLSPSYIRTISFIIVSAIEFATKEGYCSVIISNITLPSRNKKELQILTYQEQTQLEKHLIGNPDNRNLGILISLYTGLRLGEVCGLRWGDIDFISGTIHVRHTVERIKNLDYEKGGNKTILILGDAKTLSSNRVIPIPKMLVNLLEKVQQSDDVFVLQGKTYPYTDPRTFQYSFHKNLKECNIRNVNFHALRHTFATRCIESGMDIKSLSEILGHSSVNITLNIYVHSSLDYKRTQLDAMTSYCGH